MSPEPFRIPLQPLSPVRRSAGSTSSHLFRMTFPSDLVDVDGAPITLGVPVTVVGGAHAGEHGVVGAWAGERRILLVAEDADEDDDAFTLAEAVRVDSDDVRCEPVVALRGGREIEVVTPDSVPTAMVVPVGRTAVVPRLADSAGFFPDQREFVVERGPVERVVDVHRWASACLAVLDDVDDADRDSVVAEHLDAPTLRRVLREAALPEHLTRLVLVVSDESDEDRLDGTPDDTAALGALLIHWVRGTDHTRLRVIDEIATPVVLRQRPELSHVVLSTFRDELPRVVDGCREVVLVHSDAIAGVQIGVLTALESHAGVRVRLVQQAEDGPLVQVAVPSVVPLDDVEDAVRDASARSTARNDAS